MVNATGYAASVQVIAWMWPSRARFVADSACVAQRCRAIGLVAPVIEDQSLQHRVWRVAGSEKFGRARPEPDR